MYKVWESITTILRRRLIGDNEESIKFGVTSAEEVTPYFYIIKPRVNGIMIEYYQIDNVVIIKNKRIINIDFTTLDWSGFSSKRFGFINDPPPAEYFINNIRITSTALGSVILIGIQYDKGIHQWTVQYNFNSRRWSIFNGYGCVGLDGTVTGGAIPMFAMNRLIGCSIPIRDKPDIDAAFTVTRQAFISGQSLVFVDPNFKDGICVNAKFNTSQYSLNSLPLRFSRKRKVELASGKNIDKWAGPIYVPPVNLGGVIFACSWTWATALAGISLNSWVVDNSLKEDETYYEIKEKVEEEPEWYSSILLQVGAALATAGAGIANAVNDRVHSVLTKIADNTALDWTMKLDKTRESEREERRIAKEKEQSEERESPWASTFPPMGDKFYRDSVQDSIIAAMDVSAGLSTQPKSTAIAQARLGMSGLYSVSANQNVYAGPGFTQIHFVEGSRISGSASWAHQAEGKGVMVIPKIPPIPIPFIGTLDLNNTNIVGVNPVDGPHTAGMDMSYQPNFNIGAKHLVYSYPILDNVEHIIRQTMIEPIVDYSEEKELYATDPTFNMGPLAKWGGHRRTYWIPQLKWQPTTLETMVYDNCSIVQGIDKMYSDDQVLDTPVRVDAGYPFFPAAGAFDYCVYPSNELYFNAVGDQVVSVTIRDTKVLDGEPSNIVVKGKKPLIASSYTCIQIDNKIDENTLKPFIFSSDTLVLNTTGYNTIKGLQVLHGFDGYTNRIARLVGESGVDAEKNHLIYSHVEQGNVKTASIYPPTTYIGKFSAVPTIDSYWHNVKVFSPYLGNMGESHENLLGYRFSLPIIHKSLSLLPAVVQTIAPYKVFVIDGVTSLTTDIRTTSARNKSYASYDFAIYGQAYRLNQEYIARLNSASGAVAMQDVVATLGLRYLGATPRVAWFYAPSTNTFFTFTGSETLDVAATAFRIREAQTGTWDFVSQEVVFKALLERDVEVRRHAFKDIIRVADGFVGLVYPPNANVTDSTGDFDIRGMASGLILQGPERGQVNRYVIHEYMFRPIINSTPGYNYTTNKPNDSIVVNHGNWIKPKADKLEDFWLERSYKYNEVSALGKYRLAGWFMEPFKLATSFLGIDDMTDCQFEWEINFALTPLMKRLIGDKYMIINLAAETLVPGGAASSSVTHLKVFKELFGRRRVDGSLVNSDHEIGYYTFRFNAMNGYGNSEKLYIWSDGCVALRSIKLRAAPSTEKRAAPLVTRIDVTDMLEL